jgi:hypothetical protein
LQEIAKPIVKPLDDLIGILNPPAAAPEASEPAAPPPRPRRASSPREQPIAAAPPIDVSPTSSLPAETPRASEPPPARPAPRAKVVRETDDLLPPEDIPNVGAIPETPARRAAPQRDKNIFENLFGGG